MNNDKVFSTAYIVKIPLYIWILLKFKKTYVNSDVFEFCKDKHTYTTYAKKIFGKIYIMKTEHYINGILHDRVELKRIEEYPNIRGVSIRYISTDELI